MLNQDEENRFVESTKRLVKTSAKYVVDPSEENGEELAEGVKSLANEVVSKVATKEAVDTLKNRVDNLDTSNMGASSTQVDALAGNIQKIETTMATQEAITNWKAQMTATITDLTAQMTAQMTAQAQTFQAANWNGQIRTANRFMFYRSTFGNSALLSWPVQEEGPDVNQVPRQVHNLTISKGELRQGNNISNQKWDRIRAAYPTLGTADGAAATHAFQKLMMDVADE